MKQAKKDTKVKPGEYEYDDSVVGELFSSSEIEYFMQVYKNYEVEKNGALTKYELFSIMKDSGFTVDQSTKKFVENYLQEKGGTKIDFATTVQVLAELRKKEQEEDVNQDFIDAFVALGGNPDQTGYVKKQRIIDVIRIDFDLDFDIEEFLDEVGVTVEQMDYQTFCSLFEGGNDERSMSRAQSLASLFSDRYKTRRDSSTFKVNYKDFERFIAKV